MVEIGIEQTMTYNLQQLKALLNQAYDLVDTLVEQFDGTPGQRLEVIRRAQKRVERREQMVYAAKR